MKAVIISDTHFGDPMSSLSERRGRLTYVLGPKYQDFKNAAGTGNDYLVLVGDIFDFSISSYAEAYTAAKVFFSQIVADHIAEEIIYVPGNHDFEFWHWVENEVNVVNQIRGGNPPRDFRRSVPGVIDYRSYTKHKGIGLPHVTRQKGAHPYGGLFLDKLTAGALPFVVVYPNLYIATDTMSILVTHGHYLEFYWSLVGEIGLKVLEGDLGVGDFLDIKELVGVNFPTNQLASCGVGQAGHLSEWVQSFQRQIKDGKLEAAEKYLNNLDDRVVDPLLDYKKYDLREWISDKLVGYVKKKTLEALGGIRETRYSEEFINDPEVQKRFKTYYLASVEELKELNDAFGYNDPYPIPNPTHVIFGHTHRPIPWADNHLKTRQEGTTVRLHNTGGWLYRTDRDGNREFVGAEVFVCDDGQISSVRMS